MVLLRGTCHLSQGGKSDIKYCGNMDSTGQGQQGMKKVEKQGLNTVIKWM